VALNFIFMPLLCWALVGLPVALAFIVQMLTASTFYRFLIRQTIPAPGQEASPQPSRQ
jgi:integral membrane sensor domain MASE1